MGTARVRRWGRPIEWCDVDRVLGAVSLGAIGLTHLETEDTRALGASVAPGTPPHRVKTKGTIGARDEGQHRWALLGLVTSVPGVVASTSGNAPTRLVSQARREASAVHSPDQHKHPGTGGQCPPKPPPEPSGVQPAANTAGQTRQQQVAFPCTPRRRRTETRPDCRLTLLHPLVPHALPRRSRPCSGRRGRYAVHADRRTETLSQSEKRGCRVPTRLTPEGVGQPVYSELNPGSAGGRVR